jgi:hypothetical protein
MREVRSSSVLLTLFQHPSSGVTRRPPQQPAFRHSSWIPGRCPKPSSGVSEFYKSTHLCHTKRWFKLSTVRADQVSVVCPSSCQGVVPGAAALELPGGVLAMETELQSHKASELSPERGRRRRPPSLQSSHSLAFMFWDQELPL